MENFNNQYNKPTQPSTKTLVVIALVVVLAVLEIMGILIFLLASNNKSDNTSIKEESVHQTIEDDDTEDLNQSATQQPQQPQIVVVNPPAANNYVSEPVPAPPNTPAPPVHYYTEADAESLVRGSVYAFTSAVTSNNPDYVYEYFAPGLIETEIDTCMKIAKSVDSEEVVQISCNAHQLSPDRFSVTRHSTIKVTYPSGKTDNVTETYIYTVEKINNELLITDCREA